MHWHIRFVINIEREQKYRDDMKDGRWHESLRVVRSTELYIVASQLIRHLSGVSSTIRIIQVVSFGHDFCPKEGDNIRNRNSGHSMIRWRYDVMYESNAAAPTTGIDKKNNQREKKNCTVRENCI